MARAAARRAAPAMLLLLLALAALATARPGRAGGRPGLGAPHGASGPYGRDQRAEQAACANACDIMKLPDPKEPASSSTDTGKAVAGILSSVFDVMKLINPTTKLIGNLGAAVLTGVEGFGSQSNPEYQTYKMQKDLKQSTDYLACKMDALVNDLNIAADKRMSEADLDNFNSGLRAVIDAYQEKCGAMNCLSLAQLPPSQRNQGNLDCAFDMGPSPNCPTTNTFNQSATCTFINSAGEARQGQCDPNGRCYDVYKYSTAVAEMRDIVKMFASKDNLDNFNRFEKSTDTKSILALAKGSLVKILMLQQLIMLDGTGGDNGVLTTFAGEMANKLQARYDQLVDVERLVGVVSALSTPSLALNDFRPDVVIWPRPRNTTDCYKSEISFGCKYEMLMGNDDAITILAQVRKSCQTPAKVYGSRCYVSRFLKSCGAWTGSCQYRGLNICYGVWDRCVNDVRQRSWSDFVGPYEDLKKGQGKLNKTLCPVTVELVKNAIRREAVSLAADITKELADVKSIIATLRDIRSSGGMARSWFGILRKEYPRYTGACSSTVARAALGASSQRATCGRNCASCQPSWRCLKCKPGFRQDAGGSTCSK